jgi:hypothetical protein
LTHDVSQVEGIWDNGTLKPAVAGAIEGEAAAALEAEDSYDDSFDDGVGGSGNGSEDDRNSDLISETRIDEPIAGHESQFQAPPASSLPLYDVTSSQFVVHVQQQPSSARIGENIQVPIRPVKVKKSTTPSFIGLKLRLKVCEDRLCFLSLAALTPV